MKDIRQKLLVIFQSEHAEHVAEIRSRLAAIGGANPERVRPELDEAFRHAHSLKGAARAVDLYAVESLAHQLEEIFAKARSGALQLDQRAIAAANLLLDASEDCMAEFSEGGTMRDPARALEQVRGLLDGPAAPAQPVLNATAPETVTPPPGAETVRVQAGHLDQMLRWTNQLAQEAFRQQFVANQLRDLQSRVEQMQRDWEFLRKRIPHSTRAGTSEASIDDVNRPLEAMNQELRALDRVLRSARRNHRQNAWTIRSLTGQLQQEVWMARLVSPEVLLQGLRKMVRDLARDESKQIDFQVKAEDTEADRLVLQAIKDPVMHVLRNAVSHGLETPEERRAVGKPETGSLTMTVEPRGSGLSIRVEDDGRGIDLARVADVAAAEGLLSSEQVKQARETELLELLFHPGFSTSNSVSKISGRGMGLSAVQESVRRLHGDVILERRRPYGTRVCISVPHSLSSTRLLQVACEEQYFGIPISAIERLVRLPLRSVSEAEGRSTIPFDHMEVPLFRLADLLWTAAPASASEPPILSVVLLKWGGRRAAVVVGDLMAEIDGIIQPIDVPDAPRHIAGGVLLEDGTVCIVLNPVGLLERCARPGARHFQPAEPEAPQARDILVVDDSITTRSLEKSILETYGYQVTVAVDGMEALEKLRTAQPSLVITDLEMPRLDGFGLLEAMKHREELKNIPVIVVTSVDASDDRERGIALGADAYIVKRKFDQKELLETVQKLI